MKRSSLFGWCAVALAAGVAYVGLQHPALAWGVVFIGLPLVLGGCVWLFGGN